MPQVALSRLLVGAHGVDVFKGQILPSGERVVTMTEKSHPIKDPTGKLRATRGSFMVVCAKQKKCNAFFMIVSDIDYIRI